MAVTAALAAFLGPALWLRSGLPVLTDLPAQLLPPMVLRDQLLPSGRIQGWSFDWFAGFPVYRFYFPLPGLLVAILSGILGDALALRAVAMASLLALPAALWGFARFAGLERPVATGITAVGTLSVLMTSHGLIGGNVTSVVSGEFSYAWALPFLLLHVGLLLGPGHPRVRGILSGVALACAVLSHVIPAFPFVIATLPLLAMPRFRARLLGSWAVAGLLSAFWVVPMALSLGESAVWFRSYGASLSDYLPLELVLVLPATALGIRAARRNPGLAMLAAIAVAALLLELAPQDVVRRTRLLPVWYLAAHALAGAGIARLVTGMREPGRRGMRGAGILVSVVPLAILLAARGVDRSPWERGVRGMAAIPAAGETEALVERLRALPPGRVHVEPGRERLARWGGEHYFHLLPYLTDHAVLGGLLLESAPLTRSIAVVDEALASVAAAPHGAPSDRAGFPPEDLPGPALARLRLMGVRYLVAHTPGLTASLDVAEVPEAGRFGELALYDLGPAPLVTLLTCWEPADPGVDFRDAAAEGFRDWGPGIPLPVRGLDPAAVGGVPGDGCAAGGSAPATGVVLDDGAIRFRAVEVGRPHLVRVSYFPDWRVHGGDGPWPASPWFMVVIPTREEVELAFAPGPIHRLSGLVSVAAVLVLAGFATARLRSRSPRAGAPDSPPGLAPTGGGRE